MIIANFAVNETFGVERKGSLIQCGFPADLGVDHREVDVDGLQLRNATGRIIPAEFEFLQQPSTNRAQWCRVSFLCDSVANVANQFTVHYVSDETKRLTSSPVGSTNFVRIKISKNPLNSEELLLRSGDKKFRIKLNVTNINDVREYVSWRDAGAFVEKDFYNSETVVSIPRFGSKLEFRIEFLCIPSSSSIRLRVVAHNKDRALHPNGLWDLGDSKSANLKAINLEVETLSALTGSNTLWNCANEVSNENVDCFTLLQLASGGETQKSRVHVNKLGLIAADSRGYLRQTTGGDLAEGNKHSPTLVKSLVDGNVSFAFPEFWQRFPSGLSDDGTTTTWHFLPQWKFDHEIQAGEKCCKEMWILLESENSPADLHCPLVSLPLVKRNVCSVDWGVQSNVSTTREIEAYISEMLDGTSDFFKKRELIDEYGWRNFGDVWADHEAPYAEGVKPIVSHYNNQYDLLNGFLLEFLRSGDKRWWDLAEPLATHIINVDLYDTHLDKAGFNQGLFWHTAHYRDAGTASHRSYGVAMTKGERHRINGGGPGSNEQAYSSGLRLYFQLTGDQSARRAVVNLGDWIIAMDDGSRSILAPLSGLPTGRASSTALANFHGPGRGAGNAINCLLDAWLLTDSKRFLDKAHEIILRVIHPDDDVASLNLLNAEIRWSYTVFLQSLLKYLDLNIDVADNLKSYVKASLCSYGEWMLENETLYFERVNELEFPTETWHAQDIRKANMMIGIACLHPNSDLSLKMKDRGNRLRADAWKLLLASDTKLFSRPFALALQQLPIQLFVDSQLNNVNRSEVSLKTESWPKKQLFIDQKSFVKGNLKNPIMLFSMAVRCFWLPHWIPTLLEVGLTRRIKTKLGMR